MSPSGTVAFHTLGCKLNFAESGQLARQFREAGYALVDEHERPDVLVVNTCSVTEDADRKCRNIISRVIRQNPETFVAVVGCFAQLKPQSIAGIPGVKLVLGAGEKFNLVEHIAQHTHLNGKVVRGEIRDVKTFFPAFNSGDRTRTFLKVQDGCNYFCSFCTIPLARGRSRSATIEQTLIQVQAAAHAGAREVVLTGVNLGDFGTSHGQSLFQLMQSLERVDEIERFRISSIEPNLLTDEMIAFVAASKKFMPHFHIPLQSGSDEILMSMRRRYLTAHYQSRVEYIKRLMPHACIGVDVITGFPGETDKHFKQTHEFIQSLKVDYLHVFTYSERPGTTAVRLSPIVPVEMRHKRTQVLRLLSEKMKRAHALRHSGELRPVLWEAENTDGLMYGYTDNYIRVFTPWNHKLVNTVTLARLGTPGAETGVSATPQRDTMVPEAQFHP